MWALCCLAAILNGAEIPNSILIRKGNWGTQKQNMEETEVVSYPWTCCALLPLHPLTFQHFTE